MTNAEKYRTVEERTKAYREYCNRSKCTECPNHEHIDTRGCGFAWLDLEALMSAKEVADILEDFNRWHDGEGEYFPPKDFSKALKRAVEILRNVKED